MSGELKSRILEVIKELREEIQLDWKIQKCAHTHIHTTACLWRPTLNMNRAKGSFGMECCHFPLHGLNTGFSPWINSEKMAWQELILKPRAPELLFVTFPF